MKLKKRGIVIPDQHYPLEDRAAVECVKGNFESKTKSFCKSW